MSSSRLLPTPRGTAALPTPRHPAALPTPRGAAALLTAGVTIALALGACTTGDDDEAPPVSPTAAGTASARDTGPTYARYVALGDSFAALGPTSAPTTGPAGCLRSTRNYPALLAGLEEVGELVDVSCGGAETSHLTVPQTAGAPPQFEALTANTDLVTLSIGGNDIGFGAMASCIVQTPRAAMGAPCRDRLEITVTDALDRLGDRLGEVYTGIRQRSPDARVITTAYMPLVPDHGGCEFISRMSPGDVTWTRHVTERINMIVADAADTAGADVVVPADAGSRHACAPPADRYTDFTGVETGSHPMHLTAAGHRAMAEAVGAVL
ncbi:SGNH/GDSL hydrolase family protein [Rhodococcus sp. IEGM 1408]|uniref:SGNH/GDSL hydrolase family protein n=1 Tax=Rhodococcus sp. IEGM 1408 TaxID=3082220 RepID=UPI0029541CF9|nr:SGNH/GDSL hydrolase family protein [Rhodococcus sp. IEGM 1408]MDV8001204.1 SGNH/GDSL hydrolase family protein [Rhodococcus sp. IEGM 1408]